MRGYSNKIFEENTASKLKNFGRDNNLRNKINRTDIINTAAVSIRKRSGILLIEFDINFCTYIKQGNNYLREIRQVQVFLSFSLLKAGLSSPLVRAFAKVIDN